MSCRGVFAVLYAIACSLSAYASRMQIAAYAGSTPVTNGEVCFFSGRNGDPFFDRFLASGDVHCHPLTDAPEPSNGLWNYYIQTSTQVSAHPLAIEINGPGTSRPARVELLPAGTLDVAEARKRLRPGEYFALYISNDQQRSSRPAIRPIPATASGVLIPANMRLLLLVIDGGQIVWASRSLSVAAGGKLIAPVPDRTTHDVIAVVGLDTTVGSSERQEIEGTPPPSVRLIGKGRTLNTGFALRSAPQFDTSIVEFFDVPPGTYDLVLSGPYWLNDHAPVTVPSQSRVISQPARRIVTRPRAGLQITWHVPRNLASSGVTTCTDAVVATHLRVARCAYGFGRGALQDCVTAHDEELHDDSGERRLDALPAGDYTVALLHGETVTQQKISIRPGRTASVDIALTEGRIHGRITHAGRPVAALVRFATGSTRSDENGDYVAFVSDAPGDRPVVVTPCDRQREFVDLPPKPLLIDDRYDVDIPENQLTIAVVDARTGSPLPNSTVTSRIITSEHTVSSRVLAHTDAKGLVTDEVISPNVTLEICARHEGYEGTCVRDVRMHQTHESKTVALQPAMGRLVRIVGDPPIAGGRVYTVVGSRIIGDVAIEQDHTVRLDPASPPGSLLYVVAANYPLMELPWPDLTVDEPALLLPRVNSVTRTITLSPESPHHGGPIGLEIDGRPVPDQIFRYLEMSHGTSPTHIRNGETVVIGPFDASLRLTLLLWRFVVDLAPDLRVREPFNDTRTLGLMYRAPLTAGNIVLRPER